MAPRKGAEFQPAARELGAQGRLGEATPVAVVDIGSNSVRQVIYEGLTRAPAVLFNEKVLCGLGTGVATTGRLDPKAVDRALGALRRFRALGIQANVDATYVIATAAARDAANGAQFLAQVEEIFANKPTLLTGALEAGYSALGIRNGFYKPLGIAGDLGGGSLELVAINGADPAGVTLPLGSLRLAEASGNSMEAARKLVRDALAKVELRWPGQPRRFYAIGGTWRSLAKLHIAHSKYPLPVLHDYTIPAAECRSFCERLTEQALTSFRGIEAVSRNRRTLLPYGALVMSEIIARLDVELVTMSSLGVREGFLYTMLDPAEQAKDSLLSAAYDLAILRARSPRHSVELAEWTGMAFAALGVDETENEERWRIAACYLADIAWRAHPDYRAQQSLSIIANAGFVGICHEGRAYLALANYYRYRGLGGKVTMPEIGRLASKRVQARARLLAAMFRVLYLFSASLPGILPLISLKREGGEFRFCLPSGHGDLLGERPLERISQLSREAGVKIKPAISEHTPL